MLRMVAFSGIAAKLLKKNLQRWFRRGLFLEPLPTVTRAIFICTPHRGSFVAGRRVLANITYQLLSLPFALTGVAADINRNLGASKVGFVPTAVDNMSPGHPFIMGLHRDRSPRPSRSTRSSRSKGTARSRTETTAWSSALRCPHRARESELVVRSGHSVQGNPHAIEEVRRILRLHAGPELTPELTGVMRLESLPCPAGSEETDVWIQRHGIGSTCSDPRVADAPSSPRRPPRGSATRALCCAGSSERFFPELLVPVQPANRESSTWAMFYGFDQYLCHPGGDRSRGIGILLHVRDELTRRPTRSSTILRRGDRRQGRDPGADTFGVGLALPEGGAGAVRATGYRVPAMP